MGLAHEKKSYLQEKANLFEIGSMDILQKLCKALDCNIGDIMDMIPEDK